MTLEQNVQQIIGAMALQVAQLQTENQQLTAANAALADKLQAGSTTVDGKKK